MSSYSIRNSLNHAHEFVAFINTNVLDSLIDKPKFCSVIVFTAEISGENLSILNLELFT